MEGNWPLQGKLNISGLGSSHSTPARGRVTGAGQPVTSPGMEAWRAEPVARRQEAGFSSVRAGKWELWEKSLVGRPRGSNRS